VAAMEDVLEVYSRPYDPQRPVVCMDEMHKQCIKEVREPIPASPGNPERYDSEYERNGGVNIFLSSEPMKGNRFISVTDRRTKLDWAYFIKELVDVQYQGADRIVLVMDNLNTHTPGSLYEAFEPQEARRLIAKLEIHHTPKHGSWLNVAEIELSVLSRQCLNRRIPDKETYEREIKKWKNDRNDQQIGVDWHFTTKDARIKLKRLYPKQITKVVNS
jgi:DDE superfamily endonuclease